MQSHCKGTPQAARIHPTVAFLPLLRTGPYQLSLASAWLVAPAFLNLSLSVICDLAGSCGGMHSIAFYIG